MYSVFDRVSISDVVIVFFLFFILTFFLLSFQLHPTLLDPDGFFHAKMSLLTGERGYVTDFTWLPTTTLSEFWTDQHYVYHLLAVPFVTFFDPLWGMKIFSILLGVLFGITFFFVLKNVLGSSRRSFWWTLILFSSAGFVLRITQIKAQPLALILFILILFALYRKRFLLFFLVTFLYVHTHGSFILVPLIVGWQFLFEIFYQQDKKPVIKKYFIFIILLLTAIALGFITQPTFPNNIIFYYHQIIEIAVLRTGALEIIGLEWASLSFIGWMRLLGPLFIPMSILVASFFLKKTRLSPHALYFSWLLLPFVFLTTHSIRHLEFFLPIFVLTLGVIWYSQKDSIANIFFRARAYCSAYPIAFLAIAALPFIWVLWGLVSVYSYHKFAPSMYRYSSITLYIQNHIPVDEVIVNVRWDMFPAFFYFTDNSYLVGMDPGFFYLADRNAYRTFDSLRDDGVRSRTVSDFMDEFGFTYLLTMTSVHDEREQIRLFIKKTGFNRLHTDDAFSLYSWNADERKKE